MADVTDIIEYYQNLLIIQYHDKKKAKATIGALVKRLLANGLLFDVRDAFNIDDAIGVQLDILGKYIGINRYYKGQEFAGHYFAFSTYTEFTIPEIKVGFSTYSLTLDGKWLKYQDILSQDQKLNDDDYRILLKLKIIQNNSNHSHKEVDDSMYEFFANGLYPDSLGNMEMDYFIPSGYSSLIAVILEKNVLPRPMGVELNYIVKKSGALFGFSTYESTNENITGFTTYDDYDTKDGELLTYEKLIEA